MEILLLGPLLISLTSVAFLKNFATKEARVSEAMEKWSRSSLHCSAPNFLSYLDKGGSPEEFAQCIPPSLDYDENYGSLGDSNALRNLFTAEKAKL